MSAKHPIISVTGSSGAGTTSVRQTFENIFRREHITAAFCLATQSEQLVFATVEQRVAAMLLSFARVFGRATGDHLVTPAQSQPFTEAVSSADRKTINFPAGHIGLAVGSKAHRDLWPQVCDWLEQRSDKLE